MTYAGRVAVVGVVLFLVYSKTDAMVAPWKPCDAEANATSHCTINEVRIDPCKEAEQHKPCRVKRGQNASIEFDYTVDFASETLEANAFWKTPVLDLPFMGMNNNGCEGTSCPTVSGERRTYRQDLHISKQYPVRPYDVKWILATPSGQQCCFIFQIKIHK